jgi:hypothetical protein
MVSQMKYSRFYFIIFSAIVSSHCVQAQKYQNGSLVFKDGKMLKGLVTYPSKHTTSEISYKASEQAEEQTFKSDELKTVVVNGGPENFEFDRGTYIESLTFKGDTESKPRWMVVLIRGPVTLYTVPLKVKIKDGKLTVTNQNVITYYAKRDSEKVAKDIAAKMAGVTAGLNEDFQKRASEYFKDYPELVKKINSENLKVSDVFSVVEQYNKWASSKRKK